MSFLLAIVARPSASTTGPMRMAGHLAQIAISDRAFVRTDPMRMAGHFANIAISERVHFTFYHAPVSDKREKTNQLWKLEYARHSKLLHFKMVTDFTAFKALNNPFNI